MPRRAPESARAWTARRPSSGRPGRALDRARADRSWRSARSHAGYRLDRQLDVGIGHGVGAESAVGLVPGDEAVQRRQEVGGGHGRIDGGEDAGVRALADDRAEASLVGIASGERPGPALGSERTPFMDEHAGTTDVLDHYADMGKGERPEPGQRVGP